MNLAMNQRSPRSTWRDVFRAHGPTTDRPQRPPRSTNGEMTGDRFHLDWFAQRTWEDDGGQVGQDLPRLAG